MKTQNMEQISAEDSAKIQALLDECMIRIVQEAKARLHYPIKVTASCPIGTIVTMTMFSDGTYECSEPTIPFGTFPVVVKCTGLGGQSITGTIEEPTKTLSGGQA
jgi:hypothetical protein